MSFPRPEGDMGAYLSRQPVFSANEFVPEEFVTSHKALERELQAITQIRRSDGRLAFSGLGFYPEMGTDYLLGKHVRGMGHLIGMSMHESELLICHAFAAAMGDDLNGILGKYVGSRPIERDLTDEQFSTVGQGVPDEKHWRLKKGWLRSGLAIGSFDWRHWGMCRQWENMTFLPSVSGDFKVMKSALGERKLDWVYVKGTHGWRFHYEENDSAAGLPHGRWVKALDEGYMAENAVAAVSFMDRPLVDVFKSRGYRVIYESDKGSYPEKSPLVRLVDVSERECLGVKLLRGAPETFNLCRGDFTVLERRT
jgi:hypothetical protein